MGHDLSFPAYVPPAVRTHIENILDGEPLRGIPGYVSLLKEAKHALEAVSESLERKTICGEIGYLDDLRKQRIEAVDRRNRLEHDVDCLHRLAHDSRMRNAFAVLAPEINDDEKWCGFIYAAWAARMDFSKHRDRLKRAAELKGDIADTAEKLAGLIRQFTDAGVNGPSEMYSIPELLRQTDNHEMQNHNLHMWRIMRCHVLGDLPRRDIPEAKPDGKSGEPMAQIEITWTEKKAEIDPEERARNALRYAWGTAPDFSALLETMANAVRAFKPVEHGMIGAAIDSRQRNPKTEYLRAFGNLLTDVHRFKLTSKIMQAMAIVATVVINLPDVDVTYDDVKKVLTKPRS